MTHENKELILNKVVLPLTTGMLPWYALFWDRYAHSVPLSMLGSYEEEIVQVMINDSTVLFPMDDFGYWKTRKVACRVTCALVAYRCKKVMKDKVEETR